MNIYIGVITLLGVLIGSFLNVCILRIPQKMPWANERSACPKCNKTLSVLDLVPVLSFIFLRGKCLYCKTKISIRYPLVELLHGVLYLIIAIQLGMTFQTVIACMLASILVFIAFVDLDTKMIYDTPNFMIFLLGVCQTVLDSQHLTSHIIGFFAVSVPMFVITYVTGGFGGGDIKLMAAAGLLLGGWSIALAFLIGGILASIFSIGLILRKKATKKSLIPFGPFLSIGIYVCMLFGEDIITWYLDLASIKLM